MLGGYAKDNEQVMTPIGMLREVPRQRDAAEPDPALPSAMTTTPDRLRPAPPAEDTPRPSSGAMFSDELAPRAPVHTIVARARRRLFGIRFKPNAMQRRLLRRLWNRNIVLKARQLGVTTLFAILWLDTALFADGAIRCGMIAHEKGRGRGDLCRKDPLRLRQPARLAEGQHAPDQAHGQPDRVPHNGASVVVTSSGRSGTAHRLHVSELGKMAAKYPGKAKEVVTGSLPSVPKERHRDDREHGRGQEGGSTTWCRWPRPPSTRTASSPRATTGSTSSPGGRRRSKIDPRAKFSEAELAYFHKVQGVIGRQISDAKRACTSPRCATTSPATRR